MLIIAFSLFVLLLEIAAQLLIQQATARFQLTKIIRKTVLEVHVVHVVHPIIMDVQAIHASSVVVPIKAV